MENSVMLNAVCNEPVSLKVLEEPFYRKGFSPFVNKQTGTWWEYDDDKKGFFDTGIIAQGRDGNDYVITEQDYNTIVERTLSNVNPTLDEKLSSKLPKSPTNWEPWTSEEQAAARERIGASKKLGIWEDIATVNITEDATAITVNLDANGNTFSLSDIICEITIPTESPVKQRGIYFGVNISIDFAFSRIVLTTNERYIFGAITYARIVSGRVICDGAIGGPSNSRYQPCYKYAIFNGHGGIEAESFDSVSVFTYSDAFPAGTTVILKGIRT